MKPAIKFVPSIFYKKFLTPNTLKNLIIVAGLALSHSTFATSITNEYSITSTAVAAGPNTWKFSYSVTNNNQGAGNYYGFDGFSILVPDSSTLIDSTVPTSYLPGGYWQFLENPPADGNSVIPYVSALGADAIPPAGYHWDIWWGYNPQSVYPVGTTATFGVTLSNVSVGVSIAPVITYLGYPNYAILTANVTAPSAVPIPSAFGFALSEFAALGLIAYRRRIK